MPSITYTQLKNLMKQVDVNRSGRIEFWEFFAWQTFLILRLGTSVPRTDFDVWMRYAVQTNYTRMFIPKLRADRILPQSIDMQDTSLLST